MPYDMLLSRLFKHVMAISYGVLLDYNDVHDRVMYPITAQQERKTRKDYGTKRGRYSTSSSSTFGQPSSSHLKDDNDDGNDEGTLRVSTPSPICFVNSLTNKVPRVFENPPNINPDMEPFYTHQTEILNRQVQLRDEHRGGLMSIGKGIKNLPSNPIPLQSHPSLDITLSLSLITPLDHILDTPSPQPPPQPPLMGHPITLTTITIMAQLDFVVFTNRNLFFTFRDEMNLMFAHLEYLLTSAIALPSLPHL
ncbi:hypothetical protein Tco_0609554 [Tanacetum coccineum]